MLPIDSDLSVAARAVWELHCSHGRVMPATEIKERKLIKAGSTVLNRAMKELQSAGYIALAKGQDEFGRHYKKWKLLPKGQKIMDGYMGYIPFTESGYTDIRKPDDGKSNDISSNSNMSLEVLRTSNLYAAAGAVELKGKPMAWEILGDEIPVEKKVKLRHFEEEEVGVVGKVVDKKTQRQAKYKPTKVDRAGKHREDIPEDQWKTKHIVAEFNSLVVEKNLDAQMQLNSEGLASWMNKMVGAGAQYATLLKAIRMFNSDPRNFHDVGKGKPVWQRFIGYYQTVQGVASAKPVEYRDDEFDAHKAAMLEVLKNGN